MYIFYTKKILRNLKKCLAIFFIFSMFSISFAQTYTMTNGTSISTCSGTFYDPGGTGNYGSNLNRTFTICPSTPGSFVSISFTSFNTESGYDYLYIYDGNSPSSPLLGQFSGTNSPGVITATANNTTGCLTFRFTSDFSIERAGWAATISCTTTPPTLPPLCASFEPFCTGTQYIFPNTTGLSSPNGPNYGCLVDQPNPAWFYMQVGVSGNIEMDLSQEDGSGNGLDVDFAMWGPYTSINNACTSIFAGAAPIQTSYHSQSVEVLGLGVQGGENCFGNIGSTTPPSAVSGQVYVVLITNYSDDPGFITFEQTGGSGATDCSILFPCSINSITATPSGCNSFNQYSVSGTISVTSGPNSGNLVVTNSCGGSQTIPATGASTYNYTISGIAAPSVAGTCTISAEFTANSTCALTQTYSQPVRPTANAGADNSISCTVPSIQIGTPAIAGNTYSWNPAAGLSNAATAQPTATIANTYTVTVTNNTNSCFSSDQVNITSTGSFPTANAGVDKTLNCTTPSVSIGTPAISGYTYSWSPSAGLSNSLIAEPTANAPNTYTLTVTNTANGCTATDVVVVSRDITAPIANAGTNQTLTCTNPSLQIGTAAIAGNTYAWSPASGLSNAGIAQPIANAPNTYTLTVTNTANGCTATDIVVVSKNITPPVANAGADKTLTCANPTSQIGTAATPGNTYAWLPASGLSNAGIAQPVANAPNTYTLTVTNTANGCTATDAVVVAQNITPPTANAGPDRTLTCANTSFVIGTTGNSNNSYSWSPAFGLSNSLIAQPTVNSPGTYTLTVTNNTNGCSSTDAVIIGQNITPPIANAGADKTLTCAVTSIQIGSTQTVGNTYSWSPSTNLSNPISSQPFATAPGNYTVTVTNTANGCAATDVVNVARNITPPIANAGTDKTLTCTNTSFVIGTAAVAGNTYTWSPAFGLDNANIAQPVVSSPGTYTLTVTNSINGCTATDQIVISQNITAPAANAGPNKTLTCANPSLQIGTAAITGNTYTWSPTAGMSNPNIAQPTITIPTTYTVTVKNSANGCISTDAVTISQNITPPTANAGADKTLTCTNTSFTIGAPGNASNTYSWSPATGLDDATLAQPIVSAPNTYTLTVTNIANGCKTTDQVLISRNITPPTANAGADKTLTCTNTSHVIGTTAVVGNSYAWTPATGLDDATIAQPIVSLPDTYTLTVTNNSNGCIASNQVVISQNITPPIADAGSNQTLTCANPSLQIGTAAIAGNTYTWSSNPGLSNPNIAQPTVNAPSTYSLTVKNNANGCTATDAVTISQNITPPTANAGNDKTLTCTNTSFIIGTSGNSSNTYSWSPAIGLDDATLAQPTVSAPNTYTLTVTNIANGCKTIDQVVISKNITPPVANAGIDKTLTCADTSLQIGSPAVAGNTYSWNPALDLSNPLAAQPFTTVPGTYTLTVTSNTNGCTSTDEVIIAQNIAPPVANAGIDKTLTCANPSLLIGSTAIAGNTYVWSPAAGLDNPLIAQPTTSVPDSYTLTVTNTANGCSASDAVLVSQNITPPLANAGSDKTLTCVNTSLQIGTPEIIGNTYLWSPTAGISNPSIAQPNVNSPAIYTVTVTNIANGCTATNDVNITQNITPPVANAGADKILTCTDTSFLIGSPSSIGNTYAWSPVSNLDNPAIAQPTVSGPGNYTLTVTKTSNGCKATDAVLISQNITPPIANAGADKTLTCTNISFLIGTAEITGNTYNWSPTSGLDISSIAQPTVSEPGTYILTVKNNSNGCVSTDEITINKNITLPFADAGANQTLTCTNPSLQIGTAAITGNTYLWSPANGLSNAGLAQPIANVAGTFTLTVTNTANGCKSTDNVTMAIDTIRPFADAGVSKTLTCATTSVSIGTAAIPGNTYSWSPINGLNDPSIAQPTTNTLNNYTVTVTKNSNGCKSSDQVIILQNITTSQAFAGNDLVLTCTNQNVQIGSPSQPGNSYAWSPANGLNNAASAQPIANKPGTYTLTVTNLVNGCTTNDVVNVRIDTLRPVANAGIDKSLNCAVKSLIIGTPAVSGNTYAWQSAPGISNTAVAQPAVNATGTYSLTVTKNANGCIASDAVTIFIDTIRPIANAGEDQTFGCPHESLTVGTPALPNMSYTWLNALGLSENNIAQPTTDTAGTFVLAVVNRVNYCKSAPDTVVISPRNCECSFFVPTAFSPNNDGINDVLTPFKYCDDYRDFSFSIFNRWGELVFKSDDIINGWNGVFKSESQQVDSYIWTLEYFDVLYNTKRFEKGVFTLLK